MAHQDRESRDGLIRTDTSGEVGLQSRIKALETHRAALAEIASNAQEQTRMANKQEETTQGVLVTWSASQNGGPLAEHCPFQLAPLPRCLDLAFVDLHMPVAGD